MNKEDKSKEYAELKVKQYDKYNIIDKYGIHRAMSQCNFDGNDLRDGFEAGWESCEKEQENIKTSMERILLTVNQGVEKEENKKE